jgi:protein subunit release factor B
LGILGTSWWRWIMETRKLIFSASKKDFTIQTYVDSGPGGQNRNKNETGVRIIHNESGLYVECCETKSQRVNKKRAFRRLVDKLLAHYVPKRQKERNASGTEVVRVYHAVDNRVKDSASGFESTYKEVLDDPSEMIEARKNSKLK